MTLSDALQFSALLLLPVGLCLVFLPVNLFVALGVSLIALAVELWFVGRELDLRRGDRE